MSERKLDVFFKKNPLYRTIYVDGIIGGMTPNKEFNLNFYATRKTLPKCISYNFNEDGTINGEGIESDDSLKGIVKEIEIGIYFNKKTAIDLFNILKKVIEDDDK